jgi:hypothetical protein
MVFLNTTMFLGKTKELVLSASVMQLLVMCDVWAM